MVNSQWGIADVVVASASPAEVEGRLRLVSERGNAPASTTASTSRQGVQNGDGLIRSGDLVVDTNGCPAACMAIRSTWRTRSSSCSSIWCSIRAACSRVRSLRCRRCGATTNTAAPTRGRYLRRLHAKAGRRVRASHRHRNVGYRFDPPEENEHGEAAAKDAAHGESGES